MDKSIWAIFFSIVGGVLTVLVVETVRYAKRRYVRWKFERIFGAAIDQYLLVYTGFVLRPEFRGLDPQQQANLLRHPFAKPRDSGVRISAGQTASACEIRAAAYVGPTIARQLGVSTRFVDDESLRDKFDIDFVSFGAAANDKTCDIFQNEGNDLVEYDHSQGFFVWKKSRQLVYNRRQGDRHDYGIILKIHPKQFPKRTWIACAGIGETGTSASAYFLATKWKEIEGVVKGNGKFVCVVEAETDKDESAVKCVVYQAAEEAPALTRAS
ncbi:MAG: hypothetical protein LAN62_07750 [Acidobacteriia bacterium]|nr:hypothetical protein [Terriglobia bacterium]